MSQINCLKRLKKVIFSFVLIPSLLLFLFSVLLSDTTYAQTAGSISLQGKIVRNDTGYEGLNVVNGTPSCVVSGTDTCNFKVSYYSASSGGTLYYSESFSDVEIGDYGGVFNLKLGSGTTVAGGSLSSTAEVLGTYKDVYMEIAFDPSGGTTYGEVFTRSAMSASAYAMSAGADSFGLYNTDDTGETSLTETTGAVYYNTTDGSLKVYNGSSWEAIGGGLWETSDVTAYTNYAGYMSGTGIGTFSDFTLDLDHDRLSINTAQKEGGLSIYSSYATTGSDWPLVSFTAEHTNFGASILELTQYGSGDILTGYSGSTFSFQIDNLGDLHLANNGIAYFEPFGTLPTSGSLSPNTGEGCMYSSGGALYWDSNCDANPDALAFESDILWTDGGTFTYLTSTTDDLVLGGSTTGTSAFFFDVSEGRLGIGTDTPTASLEIAGSSSNISNSTGDITITPADDLVIMGDVGIGTASPGAALHLLTSTVQSGHIILESSSAPSLTTVSFLSTSGNLPDGSLFAAHNYDDLNTPTHLYYGFDNSQSLDGVTRLDLWQITNLFDENTDIFFNTGSVGIGTDSPSYELDVNSGSVDDVARFQSSTDLSKVYLSNSSSSNFISTNEEKLSMGSTMKEKSLKVSSQEVWPIDIVFNSDGTKLYVLGYYGTVSQYTVSVPWEVTSATYASKSFDVSTQESSPNGISFSSDGSKMYVVGISSDTVYQYSLGTAWDVSTASYASKSIDVSPQNDSPFDVIFNYDGSVMYVLGLDKVVYQYGLTTGWDLSTATYASKSFNSDKLFGRGLEFSKDGSKMYLLTYSNMYQFSLSTAWDVSTASYDNKSFDNADRESSSRGVTFNTDGSKLYISGHDNSMIHQYSLSTNWDISTAYFYAFEYENFDTSIQESSSEGMFISADGTKMYIVGYDTDTVYQYDLSTAWDVTTSVYSNKSFDVSSQDTAPRGVSFSTDGTKMYIAGYTNETVYQYTLSSAWDVSTASYASKSFLFTSEASYLSEVVFKSDGTKMYLLGRYSGTFQYTLSTAWDVSTATYDSKSYNSSEEIWQEGIAFSSDGTKYYIVGYDSGVAYQYSLSSAWDISTASYSSKFYATYNKAWDPRSIVFKSDGSMMYVVGRYVPLVVQYPLQTDWDVSTISNNELRDEELFVLVPGLLTLSGGLQSSVNNTYDIGSTTTRWKNVYTQGSIQIGEDGDSGTIRYNTSSDELEFSNDGTTWIPMAARIKTETISAEYPGAVLAADGTANVGSMTSDAEGSASNSMNYYEWNSSETTLQDYDVRVRFTLPHDFSSWGTNAFTLYLATEANASTNNKVDIYVYEESSGTVDDSSVDQYSSTAGVWQTTNIQGADLGDCNAAGETCLLLIRMYSANDNYVRVGDIDINYNRKL